MQYENKKIRKSGFTLVELIVVLVILAVLAALLVPSLTGCIDKARQSAVIAETRSLVQATQTEVVQLYADSQYAEQVKVRSTYYTLASADGTPMISDKQIITNLKERYDSILSLAEVPSMTNGKGKFFSVVDTSGKIYLLAYDNGKGYIGVYFSETAEYVALKTSDGYNINNYPTYLNKVVGISLGLAADKTPEKEMWSKDAVLGTLKYS